MKNFGTISKSFHRPYNGLYGGGGGIIPLAGIVDLSATESGGTVSLTWTDPDDIVKGGKTITAWTSTKIVRKEGSAPTDSTDGDLILTETTKNQYSSSGYIDSTITVDGTYYYTAFAVADNGLETISNIESVSVVVATYKTFTIVWTENYNPSKFFVRYDDDATGLTQGSTDFDEFFGYSAVLLDENGNEVEEVKQSSPGTLNMSSFQGALTGTANNVMIKFPRRGIKMTKDGTQITLSITSEPNKEGFQYYAFTKGTTAKNHLYLGAYKGTFSNDDSSVASAFTSGTTYLKSRATGTRTQNFSPAANGSIDDFRNATSKNGTGYSMITLYPRRYVMCLYMMKYGNPYSQSIIGAGYTGGSSSVAPGGTNNQTSATYGTSSNTDQIKLFGLEDRRGNVCEFLDCCTVDSSTNFMVDKTNTIGGSLDTNLGHGSNKFIAKVVGSNDGMFFILNASGGATTYYYTDKVYMEYATTRGISAGGNRETGNESGPLYMDRLYTAGLGTVGARLQYL